MVSSAVVGFADGHRVVREVDIAVVAWGVVRILMGEGAGFCGRLGGLEGLQKSALRLVE